ncbi:MAG: FAD-dependent oxidoreductase [Chitinophagaceae bacterium]
MMKKVINSVLLLLLMLNSIAQSKLHTEVLVVGAGASGIAAGLQSARLGVKTMVAQEGPWLGGMITAAGVSAFDGNHNMPSGIWAEFRDQLYKVYGGPGKVATGWVSNTLFEPHVGDSIFKSMASREPFLKINYGLRFRKALCKGKQITGAEFVDVNTGKSVSIYARQVIDATELGDVMATAGIPYDIGMEASASTGEKVNVPETNDIIQDLTYVAIVKDYGKDADCTLVKPANYDPMEFDCCCNEFCSNPEKLSSNVTAQKMLEYGKLPNGKYMLNWPAKGNDIYLNIIEMSPEQRDEELKKAKAKTMRFLYFLQTQLGFKQLDLADDEFPTVDRLPLIPYHRESRRLQGLVRFNMLHIAEPYSSDLYRTGVAVGDYPIDHHHRENPRAPQHLSFYPIPSFNLPLGVLIPRQHKGIVIAEKSSSVSNVVNGTTRLQPIVVLTGQAAGMLAALAVKMKKQPAQVPVREVQIQLLKAGAYLMPYFDVKPTHPHFVSIQKIGATGILRGTGEPYQWANRTWFYPDSTVNGPQLRTHLQPYLKYKSELSEQLTIGEAIAIVQETSNGSESRLAIDEQNWTALGLIDFNRNRKITRAEMAVLLDKKLALFEKPIDHGGRLK